MLTRVNFFYIADGSVVKERKLSSEGVSVSFAIVNLMLLALIDSDNLYQ